MTFNSWTFVFEIINFLVLAYILQRLLYRPLHDMVDRRRQTIEDARSQAAAAQQEAEAERRQVQERLAAIESGRQDILNNARQQAEVERAHVLAEAAQESEHRLTLAREALARERNDALQALQQEVVTEATRLAARLLRDAANVDLDAQLACRVADTVRSLSEVERDSIARSSAAEEQITLEAAHELAPQAVAQVRDAVAEVLGRDIALDVRAAPELVSGVRLRLDGHVWDASVSGQLEEINNGRTSVAHE